MENQQQQAPPVQQPYYGADYYQPQRKKPVWPWILLVSALIIGVLIWAVAFAPPPDDGRGYYAQGEHIAVLPVKGTMTTSESSALSTGGEIYNHRYLLDTLDHLIADESNRGLLLYVDSPGGEVLAADELGRKIVEYKQQTGRPVYAYGHGYAASGGYWAAAPADMIILNLYCTTGSIGVTYGAMLDVSGLLEKYGVRAHTISSGAQKSMGSSLEPMSAETEAIFQAIINEYYGYFLDWVSENRGISAAALTPIADGRIYTATQAVANGLADKVGSYDEAVALLQQAVGDAECPAVVYEPPKQDRLSELLPWLLQSKGGDMGALISLLPPTGPLAYYDGK